MPILLPPFLQHRPRPGPRLGPSPRPGPLQRPPPLPHRWRRKFPSSAPITAIPSSTTTSGCARRSRPKSSPTSKQRTTGRAHRRLTSKGSEIRSSPRSRRASKRPICPCPTGAGTIGTSPARRPGSTTASASGSPSPGPMTGRRPRSEKNLCPAKKSFSTRTSPPPVRSSSLSAPSRSRTTAADSSTVSTPPATNATPSDSATWPQETTSPTRSRAPSPEPPSTRAVASSSTPLSTTPGGRRRCGATWSAPTAATTCASSKNPMSASSSDRDSHDRAG